MWCKLRGLYRTRGGFKLFKGLDTLKSWKLGPPLLYALCTVGRVYQVGGLKKTEEVPLLQDFINIQPQYGLTVKLRELFLLYHRIVPVGHTQAACRQQQSSADGQCGSRGVA